CSTQSSAGIPSFSSANTSELPISTVPSETSLNPVPDPPAFTVTSASGCSSINVSAAAATKGCIALEPETTIEPLIPSVLDASFCALSPERSFSSALELSFCALPPDPQATNIPTIKISNTTKLNVFFKCHSSPDIL